MMGQSALNTSSVLHQSAAAVFFAASAAHMFLWLRLVAADISDDCPISRHSRPFSFYFKAACFVLSWLPLPAAFCLHPASPVRSHLNLTEADAGGIQQYALVACVASFFASYSGELATLGALEPGKKKDSIGKRKVQ